jgi:hypothetical protein
MSTPPLRPNCGPGSTRLFALLLVGLVALASGCSSGPPRPENDPRTDFLDPKLSVEQRTSALDRAWDEAPEAPGGRDVFREAVKKVAWDPDAPTDLRLAAINKLLDDDDPEALADTRRSLKLRLWQERNPRIIKLIAETAAVRGWDEYRSALVRSWSRPWPGIPDDRRPERDALLALRPGQPIGHTIIEVFIEPGEGMLDTLDMDARVRSDAWDLLARLDPDGELRLAMLRDPDAVGVRPQTRDGQRILGDLRAAVSDFNIVPITGAELEWLTRLRAPGAENAAWWGEAAEAAALLDDSQKRGLRLRHIEPIRWARQFRPLWLDRQRDELLAELRSRLDGRQGTRRTAGVRGRFPESLEDHAHRLAWGDILAILVVDIAAHDPGVVTSVFEQVARDREDRTTEYGGLLHPRPGDVGGPGVFAVTLYPPRPNERPADDQFIASADMIEQGVRTLAHYHFHAQRGTSEAVAGPSMGDLEYADRYGVNCLVITWLERDLIALDYYCADGIVVDLGRIRAGR